jgi:hypothetical protein
MLDHHEGLDASNTHAKESFAVVHLDQNSVVPAPATKQGVATNHLTIHATQTQVVARCVEHGFSRGTACHACGNVSRNPDCILCGPAWGLAAVTPRMATPVRGDQGHQLPP